MASPAWLTINTHLTLYHGCVAIAAARIRAGVNPAVGRPATDFGTGFYTTTRFDQAEEWARHVHSVKYPAGNPADPPTVVKFVVPLNGLAGLNSLPFVRGDSSNGTFWSFVAQCRAGHSHAHPVRIPPGDWYDIVVGSVASWPLKTGLPPYSLGGWNGIDWTAYDQFSFHTVAAAAELNRLDRGNAAEFEVITLTP